MKQVATRLDDALYDRLRKHLHKKSLENGHSYSMDKYLKELILNDMNPPEKAPESAPKETKSNQGVNLASLLDL